MKSEIELEIEQFNEVQRLEGTHISAIYRAGSGRIIAATYGVLCLRIAYTRTKCWARDAILLSSTATRAETRAALRILMENRGHFWTPSHSIETLENLELPMPKEPTSGGGDA